MKATLINLTHQDSLYYFYIYIRPLLPKIFLTFFSLRYTTTDKTIIYFTFLLRYIQQHTDEN